RKGGEGAEGGLRVAEARRATRGLAGWLAVPALWKRGQVRFVGGGKIALTDEGRRRAESLVRAHRLWESYLGENLPLPPDHLHAPAERMEHFLDPRLMEAIAAQLRHRDTDPPGRQIPGKADGGIE